MIKRVFCSFACLLFANLLWADKPSYPVSEIKPELLAHADVVVRLMETRFDIKSYSRATLTVHRVVTIFNETNKNLANLTIPYDQSSGVGRIRGFFYNKAGQLIWKITGNDVTDHSQIPDFTLYQDDRCKRVTYTPSTYPITIDYEFEIEYSDRPIYPSWVPQEEVNVSVEQSHFTINCPTDLSLRYFERNLQQSSLITTAGKIKTFVWTVVNIPARVHEPFSPQFEELVPEVITAPSRLSYKGFDSDFNSWEDLGNWQLYLNKDRDELSPETEAKIKNLVKDITDKKERIRLIYQYMQSRTRYISINEGIGGWQPFPASFTDKYSYGDCKALTMYTKALLKSVGIESFYSIVNEGKYAGKIIEDFPSQQFNHVILCVPCNHDTIWLECTNQEIPFGFLGSATDDRKALVIIPSGSRLVSTPSYSQDENRRTRTAIVHFDSSFNVIADVKTNYNGLKYEEVEGLLEKSVDEQKRILSTILDLPDFRIRSIFYKTANQQIPWAIENLTLFIPRYASLTGNRVFIPVNLMDKQTYIPEKLENRHTEIVFRRNDTDLDTIIYTIPAGLKLESLPENISLKSVFGEYTVKNMTDGDKLISVRKYTLFKGIYPPGSYPELIDFCRKIVKSDKESAVFVDTN